MSEEATQPAYEGWAIVELMGHRQTAGRVAEVEYAGARMLRVDSPKPDSAEMIVTQFYGGSAIYCLTPCEEDTARKLLARQPYNLPPAVRLVLPDPEEPAQIGHTTNVDTEDDGIPI